MRTTGTCTKCNSTQVYSNVSEGPRGERSILAGPGGKISTRLFLEAYVCTECGFFEEYIAPRNLSDEKKVAKIKSNWTKVSS